MSQEFEETRGGTAPPRETRGGLDPWAALLSPEDDDVVVAPAARPGATATAPVKKPTATPQQAVQAAPAVVAEDEHEHEHEDVDRDEDPSVDADDSDYSDAVPAPDLASGLAADANAAAVEAWIAGRAAEPAPSRGGAFTIPLLCAGIAVIAACLLIPQADANRRLAYERLKLQADLQAVERQVEVNDEFLRKVSNDPNLAERLAQRQMKIIREGNHVLNLKSDGEDEMSPFQLTAVPAPADLPPYQPRGGLLAGLCRNAKSRLYLMGAALLAIAAGLVLGFGGRAEE